MFKKIAVSILLSISIIGATLPVMAGATYGKYKSAQVVRVGYTDEHKVTFDAGKIATVVVVGDGSSDIDCQIVDINGNLIAQDVSFRDGCALSWIPFYTIPFFIRVINAGDSADLYALVTN